MIAESNEIEYSKPAGCQLVATIYGGVNGSRQTITGLCGDRRAELKDVTWQDDKTKLATEMILGFCVNCPNLQPEAS